MNGSNRVIRGGNFNNNAQNVRSANRNNNSPGNRNNNLGARTGPPARWEGSTDPPPAHPALSRPSSGSGAGRTNSNSPAALGRSRIRQGLRESLWKWEVKA